MSQSGGESLDQCFIEFMSQAVSQWGGESVSNPISRLSESEDQYVGESLGQ